MGVTFMRRLGRLWLPIAFSLALLFPCPASADTIAITSGFLELDGAYNLQGNVRGFQIEAHAYGGGSSPNSHLFCDEDQCRPDTIATLRHSFVGLDLPVDSA